jgi:hypothetical protein
MPEISKVEKTIEELGPLRAFERLISENDALIRSDRLDIGRKIVSERTAIYTGLVLAWAQEQHQRLGYDKPFAVVALGGAGREEMAPYSDTDITFLFDDISEGNTFLLELQKQVLQSDSFQSQFGFRCEALPFSLDDVPNLDGKQLNSFLDMRAVYDPTGLAETFRERIQATYDPFEHFMHVRDFWIGQWEEASRRSEDLDQFDIKNEGLRVFLAGIWTLAGKDFRHSHEIYEILDDRRDLDAYEFLMRIRAYVHSRRNAPRRSSGGGNHPEDILIFGDFLSFGEMLGPDADEKLKFEFGNEIRARLLAARRRIALFAKSVIRRELRLGRTVGQDSPIVYGLGGLRLSSPDPHPSLGDKSRSALSLLLASQRYNTSIDLTELQNAFRDAGDWLERVPELAALFYVENGSLADTFEFLSQVDGAEDRLFPGYAKFESSLDERVMSERKSLRGKLQRQKIRALEKFASDGRALLQRTTSERRSVETKAEVDIGTEAASLDSDHIAAIKLALKTKRLPLTDRDRSVRGDDSFSLYERYSSGFSGIPLAEYYQPFVTEGGFPERTIDIVRYLIANRRAFKEYAHAGISDEILVDEFARLCGDENHLRVLFVFTCADRTEWGSEIAQPDRWFNIKEIYTKTLEKFRPSYDSTKALAAAGYSSDELAILRDFGQDFFEGRYRRYANQFGSHLLRLVEDSAFDKPKVALLRDGASIILGIASRDFRGLAAVISAVLSENGIGLRQAHLFSSSNYRLALDFFHLDVVGKSSPGNLTDNIEDAINNRRHIDEADGNQLQRLKGKAFFKEWRPNQYCLRFEGIGDSDGLIYALTYKMYWHLKANIFALTAHSSRNGVFVSIYHLLPENLSPTQAGELVETHF